MMGPVPKLKPSMKYLAILALLAAEGRAAQFPVYASPQPNTKPLTLVNFDALDGTLVGVAHTDSNPGPVTYLDVPTDATVYLTAFSQSVRIQLTEGWPEWDLREPSNLLLPFGALSDWDQLGARADALTLTLTGYEVNEPDITDGVTTLTDRWTLRLHLVPEPSAAVLMAFCVRRRRKSPDGLRVST
jgi:hypothetical protein